MHTWKKKLVVSQLALACTLAITSQANATTYDTFAFHDDATSYGALDTDYLTYSGYIYNNHATDSSYFDTAFSGDTVNGVVSTYYLNRDYADSTANTVNVTNSTIHGMITSKPVSGFGDAVAHDWVDGDVFTLNIDHSTIDDDYEAFYYTDTYLDGTNSKSVYETYSVAGLGTAVTLDVESAINISNNSHVAGISLEQGDTTNATYTTGATQWDNTITVNDSTVTSGSYTANESTGHFGNSTEPSDYSNSSTLDDVALSFTDNSASANRMVNTVTLNNSQLLGDVLFTSTWNSNFDPTGHLVDGSTSVYTHGGWADDDQNVDHLNLTLNNTSWTGAAYIDYDTVVTPSQFYDIAANSLDPSATSSDSWNRVNSANSFQSGVFDIALNNGSVWNTTKTSLIDTLAINSGSQVNVADGSYLTSDTITLNGASTMNIGEDGAVDTDHLTINTNSTVTLSDDVSSAWTGTALYANTITATNGGMLNVETSNNGASSLFTAGTLELTSGNVADNNGNVYAGVFNINSNNYVLNSDLVNDRTWDTTQANYGYGVIAMNSDGHLTVNGNGDINSGDEADASSTSDNVTAATGNYKVRIDNATGTGSVADYKGKELIYVDDVNTNATFSAANKADLGAYTYQAQQVGNTVVMQQMELTDYANMALSIPSANTNIWNLQQDTVGTRLTNARHGLEDNGGAWVSYFGGSFNGDNGTINYDQDVNGIMVGLDTKVDGNNAQWIVGAAAGFAKGDVSDNSGQVDQDSQTAYIYSSARFANNLFIDGSLNYSHFNNDLSANMSNGQYVDGSSASDAWGFGLKLGYDLKLGDAGYVTPYGSVSGLFQSGDDYKLSNDMKVDGQSYDSMRYELGVDAGYTFAYSDDQALTPYFKLAYVYDDAGNDANVNGDSIDNGTEGSAVRVGLGTQFSFTKNFSAYTDASYLGGGDVDQDWSANAGVKYTW
jgi:outer membrane autotransporter protein